jgi:hypothetical protein
MGGFMLVAGLLLLAHPVDAQVQLESDAITSGATVGASGSELTLNGSIGQIATRGSQNSDKKLFNGIWGSLYADEVFTDIEDEDPRNEEVPDAFSLSSAYPNPFNPQTQISYSLPEASHVKLAVYNMVGRRVQVLVDQQQQAGKHRVNFSGGHLSSGMYIYRLKAGQHTQMRKMMLIK